MINKTTLFHPVLLLLLCIFSVQAKAHSNYRFRTFSPEGGFYYNGISSIQQDLDGTIWFNLDNDLYRFDGYEHKNYHASFENANITEGKNRQFNSITVNKEGKVFVGTLNGLYSYHRLSDTFRKISDNNTSSLYTDAYNQLWMTQQGQLGIYRHEDGNFEKIEYEGNSLEKISDYSGDETSLFIASDYHIYKYDFETSQLMCPFTFETVNPIQSIFKAHNKLWVLVRDEGLFKLDIPTGITEKKYDFFHRENGGNVLTKMIHIDKNGAVWIATQKGLYILNPDDDTYIHHQYAKNNPSGLPNNSIWYITEDRERNIWIGTFSGGLCYVNLDEKVWLKSYTPQESLLNYSLVSAFAENENNLWIATEGGGINCLNKQTEKFTYLTNSPDPNSLSYNNTKSIVYDKNKRLWIAMFRGGMDCYDTNTNKFRHFRHDSQNTNSILTNDLRKIVYESDSGLWIIYQLNKLIVSYYSFSDNSFIHYPLDKNYDFIYDMCRGPNKLWFISENLYMIDTQTKETKRFQLKSGLLNGQCICIDGNEDIWIGTIGRGLIKFNTKTSEFTIHNEILDLNVYSIFSICTDDENNLWMGTNNGLLRYEISTGNYMKFDKQDGIQGQVFYPGAAFKSRTGELYFGGTNGFTVLNPKLMSKNNQKPHVIISGFYIDNIPAIPTIPKSQLNNESFFPKEIVLNYNQANFGFAFSSDNYLTPEKNRFRYRLKGYDDSWKETGSTNRSAFYSKVPAGNYLFEVMTANNDGIWNDNPVSIKIIRRPEPWLSIPAYLLYLFLCILTITLILRYYYKQKALKMKLYLDTIDKEKKEEIHQSQLRFFTNISHDFRTPLFLIIAVLEKLKDGIWRKDYYRILNNNANRLLNLVNELMDFRTIENGKMPLQVSPLDVNHLINTIAYDFQSYARQKDIDFRVNCDEHLPATIYADKNILEKIILNLLNNAFKYTEKGGEIILETYRNATDFKSRYSNQFTVKGEHTSDNNFIIVIHDTGIGISGESIESVFERFYTVNTDNMDSHLGTGIGLALVKSLVLLHKGTLTIYSEREVGTDLVVGLPCNSNIYTTDEFGNEETNNGLIQEINPEEEDDNKDKLHLGLDNQSKKLLSAKKRILLVEDNEDLRKLIAESLTEDFEVTEAANGLIASDILKNKEIDLIISDIMMPEMDGITFCKNVKEDINLSHIPFVLLTARTNLESKLEAAGSGADIYYEKPLDSRLLLASIHNIFTRQKKLQEHYAKNYFADTSELAGNQQDREFLKRFIEIVEKNIDLSDMDVNYIASELGISRAKLYNKVKALTSKSTVEFILNYRLKKAARMLIENKLSVKEIMEKVGIESQSYFTSSFKKEFGETPTAFVQKHKRKKE